MKNTGSRAGAEVAQLYVRRKTPGMLRPALSLAGFARVELLPGEEKTVFLPLGERSFAVWSCAKNRWVVEEGDSRHLGACTYSLQMALQQVW